MSVTRAVEVDSLSIGRHAKNRALSRASDIMTKRLRMFVSGGRARDALGTMSQSRTPSLFIPGSMIGGQVIELIHIHDVLRHGVV